MALRSACLTFKEAFLWKRFTPVAFNSIRTQHDSIIDVTKECEDQPVEMENPFEKDKEKCLLCKHDITPDYKNVRLLSQFCSSYTGRVYGRHITRLCTSKQRQVEGAIYKAQVAGLIGFMTKERTFLEDPQIFDPEKPLRPHKY